MAGFQHLPAGQIEQVGHISRSQPALGRLGLPLAKRFCRLQQWLPQPVVETHHQAGSGMAEGF